MKTKTWMILELMALTLNLPAQTPILPDSVPVNATFFLLSEAGTNGVSGPPWPFNPYAGWSGVDIYSLDSNVFAVDDRQVVAAKAALTTMSTADTTSPPDPSDTNNWTTNSGGISAPQIKMFNTNDLWISISNDPYNSYITAYNTTDSWNYQLLFKTNLSLPGWTLGQVMPGDNFGNPKSFYAVSLGDDPIRFFWAQRGGPIVGVSSVQNAIKPDSADNDPGQPGIFQLGYGLYNYQLSQGVTIYYQLTGTASNGVDYQFLSGAITFAAGANQTNLDLVPLQDNRPDGLETVIVTLVPANGYDVDTNNATATNTIVDSSTTVSISHGDNVIEPRPGTNSPGQTGSFHVSRSDTRQIYSNLTVHYSISSLASNGVDFGPLSGDITFAAGDTETNLYVPPLTNNHLVGTATLTLTLIPDPTHGNSYMIYTNYHLATILVEGGVPTNFFTVVTNLSAEPVGIDYNPVVTNIVVSISGGDPDFQSDDFLRLGTNSLGNLTLANWSAIQGLVDEIKLVVVKTNVDDFVKGGMYFGSNTNIGWLSADGTQSNLNWCILTNEVVTNSQWLRGGLCADETGIFSNDLVAVTSDSQYNMDNKGVWLVNSLGQPRLLANILTEHLEGVITLPNDTNQWGPWAGKILTGDERENLLYTIDINGAVTSNDTTGWSTGPIGSEDFDLIPTNQDLYCADESHHQLQKVSSTFWSPYVGDLLITQSGDGQPYGTTPTLFLVRWDNLVANFVTVAI
ncbi:MAG: hypothetical protein KGJ60_07810, partial [Verrucomicrobiota bacterium]|nr:hypothetical protein [Verrucomicrobiota bacterium]